MPRRYKEVEILLLKLEQSLCEHELWSSIKPSAAALQSRAPFAVDSMPFEHWLQFVFLPKMTEIVTKQSALPKNVEILPMAEMTIGSAGKHPVLLKIIQQMDSVFANQ
jgi:uncharacterized protein YqcC (DUF446 family)